MCSHLNYLSYPFKTQQHSIYPNSAFHSDANLGSISGT